jgi:hypothetical protein
MRVKAKPVGAGFEMASLTRSLPGLHFLGNDGGACEPKDHDIYNPKH